MHRTIILISNKNVKVHNPVLRSYAHSFVPEHELASDEDVFSAQNFLNSASRLLVITGAGVSTESGVPDYRSEGVGLYARSPNRPVQYKDFLSNENVRKRYWARNFVGWPRFSSLQPNNVHLCLKQWENIGLLNWVVTQNVDRLHHKAGAERVIELHGTSYRVKCLACNYTISRFLFQQILLNLNRKLHLEAMEVRPDGDVEIDPDLVKDFIVPPCDRCGGVLKPNVVFFGETVPKDVVEQVYEKLADSDAILALGSSLEVYSAYRFIVAAVEQKKPVGIINIGPTRADNMATLKLSVRCGDILSRIRLV